MLDKGVIIGAYCESCGREVPDQSELSYDPEASRFSCASCSRMELEGRREEEAERELVAYATRRRYSRNPARDGWRNPYPLERNVRREDARALIAV